MCATFPPGHEAGGPQSQAWLLELSCTLRYSHVLSPMRGNSFYYSECYFHFEFFFFPLHCLACGILVPQAWIEPRPSAVRAQSPDHWVCCDNHVLTGQHVESPQETPRRLLPLVDLSDP